MASHFPMTTKPTATLQAERCFISGKAGKRHTLSLNRRALFLMGGGLALGCLLIDPAFGVTVEGLKAPVADLKDTIFNGWMWVPKIGAAVGGCLMAVYNQSIVPLATGAGIGLGIHFYDLYIKADGALI